MPFDFERIPQPHMQLVFAMRGDDLCNKIDNGRAALEFCGVGIGLRDIALEAVFAQSLTSCSTPKRRCRRSLLTSQASRTRAGSANTPPSDLVDRSIEIERPPQPSIEAPRNRYDTFHGRAGNVWSPAAAGDDHSDAVVAPIAAKQQCRSRGSRRCFQDELVSTVPVSPWTLRRAKAASRRPCLGRLELVNTRLVLAWAQSWSPSPAYRQAPYPDVSRNDRVGHALPSGLWTRRTEMTASPFLMV